MAEQRETPAKANFIGSRTRHSSHSEGEGSGTDEFRGTLVTDFSQLLVGMRLEAMDKYGKWYVAKVVELDQSEGEVLVHFERWSSRYDELVPIKSGRLRQLSLAKIKELEKEKEKVKKELKPGDRIQSKWVDGRMYYGKVVRVHGVDVDLLFDDGEEYTAPVIHVRKRVKLPEKSPEPSLDDPHHSSASERRQRADKRKRKENSNLSPSTHTSPSNSSLSTPPKKVCPGVSDSGTTGDTTPQASRVQFTAACDVERQQIEEKSPEVRVRVPPEVRAPVPPEASMRQEGSRERSGSPEISSQQDRLCLNTPKSKPRPPLSPQVGIPVPEGEDSEHTPTSPPLKQPPSIAKDSAPSLSQKPVMSTAPKMKKNMEREKNSTVATRTRTKTQPTTGARTRAQTKPKVTESKGERNLRKVRGSKSTSKASAVELDHNEFKCKKAGCTKSFRKLSLLESHIKHYHSPPPPPKTPSRGKGARSKVLSPQSPKSPKSPSLTIHTPKSKSTSSKSPEATKSVDAHATPVSGVTRLLDEARREEEKKTPVSARESKKEGQSTPKQLKLEIAKKHCSELVATPIKNPVAKGTALEGKGVAKGTALEGKGVAKGTALEGRGVSWDVQTTKKHHTSGGRSHQLEDRSLHHRSSRDRDNDHSSDDVVHCLCGSDIDEGFMIQCEQCLCWQHGDCIGIRSNLLPKKYICYICCNPPGQRNRLKYKFSRDWYGDGTLPSISGGPGFPVSQSKAVLLSHKLVDSLYKVKKMVHSSEVKLQAASNPNHPYLKQWAKECSHYNEDSILSYVMNQLLPVSYQPVDPDTSADTAQPQAVVVVKVEQEVESCGDDLCPMLAGTEEDTCAMKEVSVGVAQTKGSGDGIRGEEERLDMGGVSTEYEGTQDVGGVNTEGSGIQDVGAVSTERAEGEDVSGINTEGSGTGDVGGAITEGAGDVGGANTEGAGDVGGANTEGVGTGDVGGANTEGAGTGDVGGANTEGAGTGDVGGANTEGAGTGDVSGARKRTLRNSTLIQKNAVYCLSRRNKKQKQITSPQLTVNSSVAKEEGTTPPSLTPPSLTARERTGSPIRRGNTSDLDPNVLVHPQSSSSTPPSHSQPTLLSHSHVVTTPLPHSHVTALLSHSHITPEVAVGSSGSNATSQSEHAEMMEIVSMADEEFGVSEVPVFAMEPDRSRQPVACLPQASTPLSIITLPHPSSVTSQQPHPSSAPSQQPHPSSAPSQQPHPSSAPSQQPHLSSAPSQQPHPSFVPSQQPHPSSVPSQQPHPSSVPSQQPHPSSVTSQQPHPSSVTSQQPHPSSVTSQQPHPSSAPSQQPHAPSQLHPSSNPAHSQTPSSFSSSTQSAFKPVTSSNLSTRTASPSKPLSKTEPSTASSSSSFGMKAVTLGEFSEAFIQGDTTNWFRRMKLLDHIETVQDNVQAWLEMIEQSLDDIPDDKLDNFEQFIADINSTISKLNEIKQEPTT